jgi:hypothetical protein
VGSEREAYLPRALIDRILRSATADVVLVGGQALAFWMDRFGIEHRTGQPAVSRDIDFFTPDAANSAPLHRFAEAIDGEARIVDSRALTALIGSAVAPAQGELVYNVDLLHAVFGLDREDVIANAMEVSSPDGALFLVMHPLDVLQSRNANLHTLREKQNSLGEQQFRLSIEVARAWLESEFGAIAADPQRSVRARERAVLALIGAVVEYAKADAAKKNAARYGIHLADAIPAWRVGAPAFWDKQWPNLRQRMSPAYAKQCEERALRGQA